MRKIADYVLIFLVCICFSHCHNNDPAVQLKDKLPIKIELNTSEIIAKPIKLSEIAEKIEYIPLQTKDSTLMGLVAGFQITDNEYFFQYGASVLEYDKKGLFVKNLFKSGRGPGETFARGFTLDRKNELVYVFSNYEHITKVYKYDGTLIKTIKKSLVNPNHWSMDIIYFNNSLTVETWQTNDSEYLLSSFELNSDSIRVLYKDYTHGNIKINYSNRIQGRDLICYQNQDSIFLFKETFCDTIFKVNTSFEIKPQWIIDIIGNEFTRDELIKSEQTRGTQTGYWFRSFAESADYLFLVLRSESDPRIFGLYNKTNDSIKLSINKDVNFTSWNIYLENDLDNLVNFYPIGPLGNLFYYEGCLYAIVEANVFSERYKSASTETKSSTEYLRNMAPIFESINEFSNPIIMKVYLK